MKDGRIKKRLRQILHLDETPHELAKSFAVGVFIAFTPFIGLHTIIALLLAWALRLNKAVTLTGTFVNNPWTIAFVFIGPTWAAVKVMRYMGIPVPRLNYDALTAQFSESLGQFKVWELGFWKSMLSEFKPYIHAFMAGTILAGIVSAFAAYLIVFFGLKHYRGRAKVKGRQTQ